MDLWIFYNFGHFVALDILIFRLFVALDILKSWMFCYWTFVCIHWRTKRCPWKKNLNFFVAKIEFFSSQKNSAYIGPAVRPGIGNISTDWEAGDEKNREGENGVKVGKVQWYSVKDLNKYNIRSENKIVISGFIFKNVFLSSFFFVRITKLVF